MARPKKALITRDRAIEAALATIEEDGLAEFSLGAVARRLNVKSPSLYHHFEHKEDLLEEVARSILSLSGYLEDCESDWEERTVRLCIETRHALLKYPNAAPLILRFFPRYLMLGAYDHAVDIYPGPDSLRLMINEAIEKLTYGSALFQAAALSSGSPTMPAFDTGRYPHLAKAIAANPYDDEEMFVEALRTLILGIRTRTGDTRKD
ncbi:MAG: TetR/AcrR family transcriptional regulator [Parasphingopyxis sp.]|uniref:TetR/AcrR family transcriptional regulator n=1 Tax=Parasphingopyxis sp. TaxID=1920299 RepID=UPI0032ED7F14